MRFEQYIGMIQNAGPVAWFIVGAILIIAVLILIRVLVGDKKRRVEASLLPTENANTYEKLSAEIVGQGELKPILNTGSVKCICFRDINGVSVVDFTVLPMAIGEMYQVDPSTPQGGMSSIVLENDKHDIVDYDPREEPYDRKNVPEMAYFAIDWSIVNRVFFVPVQWWKSTSVWFAAAMIAVIFISSLVVFD